MLTLDSIVLYVDNVQVSQTFYTEIFSCTAQVLSPTFVALDFATNVKITLKQTSDLAPVSNITGGGTELSVPVPDKARRASISCTGIGRNKASNSHNHQKK